MSVDINKALISYAFTCHKRTEDLLQVMPSVVFAANQSPPVEIVIVDYGEQPELEPILEEFKKDLKPENSLVIKVYRGRKYYHMSHARNLSLRASSGEYITIGATDLILNPEFFTTIRNLFDETKAVYLRSISLYGIGVMSCRRDEFIAMGGYDERFEFYGPEDKDMIRRLERRNAKVGYYDLEKMMTLIPTPNDKKVANYRLSLSKREMSAQGKIIFEENNAKGMLIANEGMEWGKG